jgi:thiol-disulfide isomerase/thioredoxin
LRRFLLSALLALSLAAVSVSAQTNAPQEPEQESAEAKPRAFRLKGLDGKTYDKAEMLGEVLVVSFGATWCVPCAWELAAIEELKAEYEGKPVRFFWVSVEDEKRTSDGVLRHYAKQNRLTIPVLRDPKAEVFYQFTDGMRVPVLVVFDREGRFDAPAHRGMSQDVTAYKQLVRGRVDALLNAPGAKNRVVRPRTVGARASGGAATQ